MSSTQLNEIWVPAQSLSTRCKNKNFRPFYGDKSLLDVLVEKLLGCFPGVTIAISTDVPGELRDKYMRQENIYILERPKELLGNSISQSDLLHHFSSGVEKLKGRISTVDNVMVAQCTDPLFFEYQQAYEFFIGNKNEGRCNAVFASSPIKKQLIKSGVCLNGGFGQWHKVTQVLEPIDMVRWSCFISTRQKFLEYGYQIPPNSLPYRSSSQLVDIDTEYDFEIAKAFYKIFVDGSLSEDKTK